MVKSILKISCAVAAIFLSGVSSMASTTVEYTTPCKYIAASGKTQFSGRCSANFGLIGADARGIRYILTFPNKKGLEIYVYNHHNLASVNGIPALFSARGSSLKVVTGENEQFFFGGPPKDSF